MDELVLHLAEEERQLVLLALAVLSRQSPGFDDALNRIACRIDNVKTGRASMYDEFRRLRADVTPSPTSCECGSSMTLVFACGCGRRRPCASLQNQRG